MSRVRVFLLCLLMLAVPLQGYAAASMALCGGPQRAAVAVAPIAMGHDMGTHAHDGHADGVALDAASTDTHVGASHHASADESHPCANCAACHAVALTSVLPAVPAHLLPAAELAEPARALATRAPRVPDKPPRA